MYRPKKCKASAFTKIIGCAFLVCAFVSALPADDAALWETLRRLDNIIPENKPLQKSLVSSLLEQGRGTKFELYGLALQAMDAKDYLTALAYFRKTIEMDPNFYYGHYGAGVALGNLGLLNESAANLNRAIAIKRNFIPAYTARAWTKNRVKNYQGAISDLTIAIQLAPPGYEKHLSNIYKNRGRAKYRMKNFEGAIADYTRAIQINPAFADAYYDRAKAWGELRKRNEACADLQKAHDLKYLRAKAALDKYCI